MNQEIKAAKKFLKKDLKNKVNFDAVARHLNKLGYVVYFYNKDKTNELIKQYNLTEFAASARAFTIQTDDTGIVYIKDTMSPEDKLRSLLHEAAHIILGHLSKNQRSADNRLQDMQAEAFAYTVLTYKGNYKYILLVLIILALAVSNLGTVFYFRSTFAQIVQPKYTSSISTSAEIISNLPSLEIPDAELVCVTKTGSKYHRPECYHVRNRIFATLTEEQAKENYTPCKTCNP